MNMYFVAIVLPNEMNQEILEWKQYMHEHYKCKVGLKSPAHITLIPPFWMEDEKEDAFKTDIDQLALEFTPFVIRTNNFSAFRPRTIFVDVAKNNKLDQLKQRIDAFFKQHNPYSLRIDTRPFHPHITIATRDLFKRDFHDVWPKFETSSYEKEWLTDSLSILRHNKKNWDVIYTSQFQDI